ncbi:MAG: hypothetical protein EBR82_07310 [Caulobacteraceae bacterium]|nr:hypothetical protein [Caulobacteraceae bacterium]
MRRAEQAIDPLSGRRWPVFFFGANLQILPQDIKLHLRDGIPCRDQNGAMLLRLDAQQTAMFAAKGWVEGLGRLGKRMENGEREVFLRHVTLQVPIKTIEVYLRRNSSKALQAKAQGSRTWTQVGASTFFHHTARCSAFAENHVRIGVVAVHA